MSGSAQFSLSFEPGLTALHRTLEDCVQTVVLQSRYGLDGIAAHLDMPPSELSRRLNAHHAVKEGSENNRPLRAHDIVRILEKTQDYRPIFWLIEKFLGDRDAQRDAAMAQIAIMLPALANLAAQAGIDTTQAKARRR